MGIVIGDIARVVYWGGSSDLLSHWQEIGRAGRNGDPVTCYSYIVLKLITRNDFTYKSEVYRRIDIRKFVSQTLHIVKVYRETRPV